MKIMSTHFIFFVDLVFYFYCQFMLFEYKVWICLNIWIWTGNLYLRLTYDFILTLYLQFRFGNWCSNSEMIHCFQGWGIRPIVKPYLRSVPLWVWSHQLCRSFQLGFLYNCLQILNNCGILDIYDFKIFSIHQTELLPKSFGDTLVSC
jgi:hypothetical protein